MSKYLNKYYPYFLIILVTFLFYSQNLKFDYSYLDDNLIVVTNYNQINSLSKIPAAFSTGYLLDNYYRPLIMISFIIDTAIAGRSPVMYHATNILVHVLFTLLLFNLLEKFKIKRIIAVFCSLIFALHPLNLNAVSWIAGRNDLIAGLFSLLSILLFINYSESGKWLHFILHQFFFLLAMFSKEIGAVIPLVLLIYLFLFNKEYLKNKLKTIRLFITWGVLGALYLYARFAIAGIHPNGNVGFDILMKNFYILFEYAAKLFYLQGIMPLSLKNYNLIIIGIVITLLLAIVIISKKKYLDKKFVWGILFFFIFIIPSLLVRLQTKDGGFVYLDCRMYLPFVGLLIVLGTFLNGLKISEYKQILSFGLVIIYISVFSFIKNEPYKNGETFWTAVTKDHPNAPYNWIGLGFYYFDHQQYLKAAKYAEKAIELNPTIDPEFYQKAALAYEREGDLNKADEFIEKALSIEKDNSVNYVNLIKNNLRLGRYEKALVYKTDLEKIEIKDLEKKANLYSSTAYYFSYSQKYPQAIELMKKASAYQPQNSNYLNDIGAFYYNNNNSDSAKKYFSKALKIEPANKEYQKNLYLVNR